MLKDYASNNIKAHPSKTWCPHFPLHHHLEPFERSLILQAAIAFKVAASIAMNSV